MNYQADFMLDDVLKEARRQSEICNACRYCEGYCSVFPAMFDKRVFKDGDIVQLASLCHNCRGCYYACQYTEPHEFNLNIPKALALTRQESWKHFAWPDAFARLFDQSGIAISVLLVISFAFLFYIAAIMRPDSGEGFYAIMSHGMMVGIFLPAFLIPLVAIMISLRRYWRYVGGGAFSVAAFFRACASAGRMNNLSGGHGEGCNFEDEDRYSNARRHYHQATLYGFLMCFASTSVATIMHYALGMEAPYGLLSLPKILGVPGGILLCIGTLGLAWLKTKADKDLGAPQIWGGEMAFVLLLFLVSFTGLVLYAATGSRAVDWLLPIHLGTVLTFFLTMPYSKMVHGFYRMVALTKDEMRPSSIS